MYAFFSQNSHSDKVLFFCNLYQNAILSFYQSSDALIQLQNLQKSMQQELQTQQPALLVPKLIESTQNIFDIAVQRIVATFSWKLVSGSSKLDTAGITALLDLCIDGAVANILFQFAPYKVLEDVMESQPIQTCEALWDILEVRKARLTASPFFDSSGRTTKSSLTLLRMCNALLRRLSKTHNTVFCGRILVFLSFTFTLNERSAVNLHSKVRGFDCLPLDTDAIFFRRT